MGRTLITVSTDGYRDFVTLPDGREFNMGSVSVLKLVLELASSARLARSALKRFMASKTTTLAVEMDALTVLLKPKRARWACAPEDRLIPPAFRGTMNANKLSNQLDLIEAQIQKLAASQDPSGAQALRGMVAQILSPEVPASFDQKLAAIEAIVQSGKPVVASELREKIGGLLQKTAVDEDAKRELALYMDNESKLYNQKKSILQNILRKMKSGKYDHKQAPKLWLYWVDEGAKMYVKEFGGDVKTTFPKALRESLAQELADDEKKAIEAGDYASIKVAGEDEEDEQGQEKQAARDKHLPGKKGFTACGERAHDDTMVESVKDATCFYCKQAWEKSHKSASTVETTEVQDTLVRNLIAKVEVALTSVTASSKQNTTLAKQDLHEISTRLAHILSEPSENATSQLLDLVTRADRIHTHFA